MLKLSRPVNRVIYFFLMSTTLTFAIQVARQAGQLLREYYSKADLQTELKSDHTIVTEADLASDRLISSAIRQNFPAEALLSEEMPAHTLTQVGASLPAAWIIDPLDGTANFSLGLPIWGVLIAHLVDGWPDLSVQYFPIIDELYVTQRGQGAFCNNLPLQAQPPSSKRAISFFSCCSRTFRNYQIAIPYKARILGSAAYSLCCVARNSAVISFEAVPKIWDIAAGWLLVNEAGGKIDTLDGSQPFPVQAGLDYANQSYPTLAAATPELLAKAKTQIQPR